MIRPQWIRQKVEVRHQLLAGLNLVFAISLQTFVLYRQRHAVFVVALIEKTRGLTERQRKLFLGCALPLWTCLRLYKSGLRTIISEVGEVKVVFEALN